jgi:hypothetical protein
MHQVFTRVNTGPEIQYYQGFVEFCIGYKSYYVITNDSAGFAISDFSTLLWYQCPFEGYIYHNHDWIPFLLL